MISANNKIRRLREKTRLDDAGHVKSKWFCDHFDFEVEENISPVSVLETSQQGYQELKSRIE